MDREDMIGRIMDRIQEADTAMVEQVYWFLMLEMDG